MADGLEPGAEQRVRESFGRQGLMAHLGARLEEVQRGRVCIRLPFRPELSQQHGFYHAGGLASVADSAGGYAGLTVMPAGSEVLTVEFKLNLLRPAQGDWAEAVGQVIRGGQTLVVCQLEVFTRAGERRVHVATGQQTLIRAEGPG